MLRGVLAVERATGVFQAFCAGLGVILTKSAKSNPCPGVLGKRLPPPGVVIMDDGSSYLFFAGGVDGGSIRVLFDLTAGEGEAARYKSRSAPSSPVFPPLLAPSSLLRLDGNERPDIGGVRGGEDRTVGTWNECAGKRSSSSSSGAVKLGDVNSLVSLR